MAKYAKTFPVPEDAPHKLEDVVRDLKLKAIRPEVRQTILGFNDSFQKDNVIIDYSERLCFTLSGVVWWLFGKDKFWDFMFISKEDWDVSAHYYLRNKINLKELDLTATQFLTKVPYEKGAPVDITRHNNWTVFKMMKYIGIYYK
ncbi:MAG: hypothetical protein FWF97_03260 [Alphaproteobacteria bacterium]|nr:hypothetical protein [Alphaproteobacteria bacterium]